MFNSWYQVSGQKVCGGTIIDASTIVTAASCIAKTFTYYGYPVQYVSLFYPTIESMFSVYAGVTNLTYAPNSIKLSINRIIQVSLIKKIIFYPLNMRETNFYSKASTI